jgi:predicted RNA-binding Zn ribbon-like protein
MSDAGTIALIGGHLALDFANTAGWHASDERSEWLTDYGEVTAWARHAGAVTRAMAEALARAADANPRAAARALDETIALREAAYRVFAALAQSRTPAAEDITTLHAAHVRSLATATPVWRDDAGVTLRWRADAGDLSVPLYPVMLKVAELLASPDLVRLRQCGRHPCGWLFLDRSRNGTRRWCSSAECGNAMRVARFRERKG